MFYPHFTHTFPHFIHHWNRLPFLFFCFIKTLIPAYNFKFLPENFPLDDKIGKKFPGRTKFSASPIKLIFGLQ